MPRMCYSQKPADCVTIVDSTTCYYFMWEAQVALARFYAMEIEATIYNECQYRLHLSCGKFSYVIFLHRTKVVLLHLTSHYVQELKLSAKVTKFSPFCWELKRKLGCQPRPWR